MPPHLKILFEKPARRLLSITGVFVWGNATTFKDMFFFGGVQKSVLLLAELQNLRDLQPAFLLFFSRESIHCPFLIIVAPCLSYCGGGRGGGQMNRCSE